MSQPEDSSAAVLMELRRKRGHDRAKVTRALKETDILRKLQLEMIILKQLEKHLEKLDEAEEGFQEHHEAVFELDLKVTQVEHDNETAKFSEDLAKARYEVSTLIECHKAHVLLLQLQAEVGAIEPLVEGPFAPFMEGQFNRMSDLAAKFTAAQAQGLVRANTQITGEMGSVLALVQRQQMWRSRASVAPATVAVSSPPAAEGTSRRIAGLKMKLPAFNGSPLSWRNFWDLFNALLEQEVGLTFAQKKVLLLDSMNTPESKEAAENAFAYTSTWEDAVAALQKVYDRNRDLHTHHQRDVFRIEHRTDDHEGFKGINDQLRRNIKGLERAKGYTAAQLLTSHYEEQLQPEARRRWRLFSAKHVEMPPVTVMLEFVEREMATTSPCLIPKDGPAPPALEAVPERTTTPPRPARRPKATPQTAFVASSKEVKCYVCKGGHYVNLCPQFTKQTVGQRRAWGRKNRRCANCLGDRHATADCGSRTSCKYCQGRHHFLLHDDKDPKEVSLFVALTTGVGRDETNIPATALMEVHHGSTISKARGMWDTGAQKSFITKAMVTKLRATAIPSPRINIVGMEKTGVYTSTTVKVTLVGLEGERVDIQPYVVNCIPSTDSGAFVAEAFRRPFLKGLKPMADPEYISNADVDILLSFGDLNEVTKDGGRVRIDRGLRAELSIFGWTLGGRDVGEQGTQPAVQQVCLRAAVEEDDPIGEWIRSYWTTDQFGENMVPSTPDNVRAMEEFQTHLKRDEEQKYCVSMSRRIPTPELGASRGLALKRLEATERSLTRRGLLQEFREVLEDYAKNDHAELVPSKELAVDCKTSYYMPTHLVVKLTSSTTKLRAVFDASSKSASGESLNSTLLPGPSLYPLLPSIINKFRRHRIGMTADISRMFREVGLNPEERDYHRFLRRRENGEVEDWRMKRLTFGVTSSPFLATQVLRQMASEYEGEFPKAAKIIREQFYVDDCLTGTDELVEAVSLRKELCDLLGRGLMTLRKWRSNSEQLMGEVPEELRETSDLSIVMVPGDCQKSLGLHWATGKDTLHVATPDIDEKVLATKRSVASAVARTFDPLGWYTPATLPARAILKEAWIMKMDWDVALPDDQQEKWKSWVEQLSLVTNHPVQRYLGNHSKTIVTQQLHGFADASQLAYGGVVYVRTQYSDDTVTVQLVAAKSKIAPMVPMTIPRMELSGALILAELIHSIAADLEMGEDRIFTWDDAAVVLGWINKPVTQLAVFVANRVAKILTLTKATCWRYVDTKENPADILSRGMMPAELNASELWWEGPQWLKDDAELWPRRPDINLGRELPELRVTVMKTSTEQQEFGRQFSSFSHLVRVTAWCWRFFNRAKSKTRPNSEFLTSAELMNATSVVLRSSQRTAFPEAIKALEDKGELAERHRLAALSPYVDEAGILRVGGRLQKSELEENAKHPMILDAGTHIVLLFVRSTHRRLMHAGISTMMSTLAPTHYINNLRTLVRRVSRECVACQKVYARTSQQMMGELPALRTRTARPFAVIGLDYAGPLMTKRGNPRKPTLVKTYILVIICFVTRAVHLRWWPT